MSWKFETTIESWREKHDVVVGIDLDGDIGLIDRQGYSIILTPKGATELMKWIREHVPEQPDDK